MRIVHPKSLDQLQKHILSGGPSLYVSSQTSTVIPYEKIESALNAKSDYALVYLGQLPKKIELVGNDLWVEGPVTWEEARSFLRSCGRDIMTFPTESTACVLAGLATSATGERCFGLGTLRDQVLEVEYLNYLGQKKRLSSTRALDKSFDSYRESYSSYQSYKNAPFPRLDKEVDLMIGTEGQLGVMTAVKLKTVEYENIHYMFIQLPRWEHDLKLHMEVFSKVQDFRNDIISCELIDTNSLTYLKEEERTVSTDGDLIFLEVKAGSFERVYERFFEKLEGLNPEDIFELGEAACRNLRVAIPRNIFEANSLAGVVKKGTDVQVSPSRFQELLEYYRTWAKGDIAYNLFGHFGDAHLHFNFMPRPDQVDECQQKLFELYQQVLIWKGSPFAEHGIGLLKQDFIRDYYSDVQFRVFQDLKMNHDPKKIFFPQGYMEMKP